MKSIWEAAEFLNALVDDSDPDTDLTQTEHLLQTSEAIRRDGHPRWMVLTGFLHDLGKCLCLYGEPQWGVVGDTFPVGCAWSEAIVFRPVYFTRSNPDRLRPPNIRRCMESTSPIAVWMNVHMSFGHDGYIAEVMKPYMPTEALYMLRFIRSIRGIVTVPTIIWRTMGDRAMLQWVLKFNQYDLYSKGHSKPDVRQLKPYYENLVRRVSYRQRSPGKDQQRKRSKGRRASAGRPLMFMRVDPRV